MEEHDGSGFAGPNPACSTCGQRGVHTIRPYGWSSNPRGIRYSCSAPSITTAYRITHSPRVEFEPAGKNLVLVGQTLLSIRVGQKCPAPGRTLVVPGGLTSCPCPAGLAAAPPPRAGKLGPPHSCHTGLSSWLRAAGRRQPGPSASGRVGDGSWPETPGRLG